MSSSTVAADLGVYEAAVAERAIIQPAWFMWHVGQTTTCYLSRTRLASLQQVAIYQRAEMQ